MFSGPLSIFILLYKAINKIIYELHLRIIRTYKNIPLLETIRMIGEWFRDYDNNIW